MKIYGFVACLILLLMFEGSALGASIRHGRQSLSLSDRKAHPQTVQAESNGRVAHLAASGHSKPAAPAKGRGDLGKFIVAIDAGHGGKDTGAIGPGGNKEKDVVYAIARRLERQIRSEPGMTPLMVRRGDRFVSLQERSASAHKAGADLFISLHADAYGAFDARGSSVFTLQVRRSDRGRFSRETIAASNRAAGKILVEFRKKQALHCRQVKRARFAVLKSREVPSMLIETGFISNPEDEKKLAAPAHQEKVARSIFNGIRAYFRAIRPARVKSAWAEGLVVARRS